MSAERSKDVLFFDLDGTLIDSQVGITSCIAYALQKMDHPVPPQETLLGWIGPSLRTTFAPLFGELARVEQAVEAVLAAGDVVPRDLGGTATCTAMTDAVLRQLD